MDENENSVDPDQLALASSEANWSGCTLYSKEEIEFWNAMCTVHLLDQIGYSKPCVKRPLKNRQKKSLNDKW